MLKFDKRKSGKRGVLPLQKYADRLYSLYRRRKEADPKTGIVRCCTCGAGYLWHDSENMHLGHYMDRRHNATRYSQRNTAPQCKNCNCFRGGQTTPFAEYINKRYGEGTAQELYRMTRGAHRLSSDWYIGLIGKLRSKLDVLGCDWSVYKVPDGWGL